MTPPPPPLIETWSIKPARNRVKGETSDLKYNYYYKKYKVESIKKKSIFFFSVINAHIIIVRHVLVQKNENNLL